MVMMTMREEEDLILGKSGPELFRELLRHYCEAEVDDYFKLGTWKDEDMRADLRLIIQHRKEAGAPPVPALEDVKMPDLPAAKNLLGMGISIPGAGVRPALLVGGSNGAAATPGMQLSDLKEIAVFVSKLQLDPSKTKLVLAKLTPARRKYVMANFSGEGVSGAEALEALQNYIGECEKENKWPAPGEAAPPAASGPGTSAPSPANAVPPRPALAAAVPPRPQVVLGVNGAGAAAGEKRQLILPGAEANKRPRLLQPSPVHARAGVVLPGTAGAVRPPVIRPAGAFGGVRLPPRF